MKDFPRIIHVKVQSHGERKIVGLEQFVNQSIHPPEQVIPQLWEVFGPRMNEIENRVNVDVSYGLFTYAPPFGPGQDFLYVAGVEVTGSTLLPIGMVERTIPSNDYAVVTYKGPISGIKEVWDFYYGYWLQQSEYTAIDNYEFEFYDSRYLGVDQEESIMDLYFPVLNKG